MRRVFPSHDEQLQRLRRIEDQLGGIRKMIEEPCYRIDIVSQMKAVTGALKQVQMGVLEKHVHHCVKEAMETGSPEQFEEKTAEMVAVLGRME